MKLECTLISLRGENRVIYKGIDELILPFIVTLEEAPRKPQFWGAKDTLELDGPRLLRRVFQRVDETLIYFELPQERPKAKKKRAR